MLSFCMLYTSTYVVRICSYYPALYFSIHIFVHVFTCQHAYIGTYMHMCVFVYIYIYTFVKVSTFIYLLT